MSTRHLPSGRHQARFTYKRVEYTSVWDTRVQAESWVKRTRRELVAGTYAPEVAAPDESPLFYNYARAWLQERRLKPRSREEYTRMLPHFAPLDSYRLDQITRAQVKQWHRGLGLPDTRKSYVYGLLRAIFNVAVDDELLMASPVRIKGAGSAPRRHTTDLPTAAQVRGLADGMPTPKYRVMLLVAAWCGLRFGELTELRRGDITTGGTGEPTVIRVTRGVVHVGGVSVVGTPKTHAGVRTVAVPPHIVGELEAYLGGLPAGGDRLLFPAASGDGVHMRPATLHGHFHPARVAAGLPRLRWHDLRHFSATTAAQTGATIKELQTRLGHTTPAAALRYQHAAAGRDAAIAEAMSTLAGAP